ncbi:MAG: ABC transporter permease [Candidatus Hydrogenedentes bacterium]|nr:ABC transporter permease [Candidatus Hydrogenedentota bacterium]
MSATAQKTGISRQIRLPNSEAAKIALRSLKIRFWRSGITMAGIVLGIAFLAYVMVSGQLERTFQLQEGVPVDAGAQSHATQIWLIAISLLVSGVGITNAMLMSVTERYREIGTMKCLGALDWFVVKLFLFEAAFLGFAGSLLGAILGGLAAFLSAMTQHKSVLSVVSWSATLEVLVIAVAVGGVLSVVGAIYPARRAGKMPPADAMRTEM